ncbi:hypothetical protein Ga0100231_003360 [Opitutaceae bacterium TAV4]|nr:hypothetical protein Ga0100231_003360 [Opitutaceae bacterium TAV4]
MPNKHINRSYLPTSESEAYIWLTNFAIQLPGVAGSFNLHTKVPTLTKAVQVLTDAHRWQVAAQTLAHERTANKNEAAWNPVDVPVLIRPATAPDGPTTIEQSAGGAYAIAVSFADAILASDKCDAAIRDALRLNPLPKKTTPADAKPQFTALIEDNQLTVRFTKARYHYFLVKIDHGAGDFDHEYPALESPFRDPTPLPTDVPQIWRVQLVGFLKGNPVGIPGDIIDVAAKAYLAEHSEGTT